MNPFWPAPPSTAYRLQKMVRRNRTAVAAGVVVGLALIVGLALASWQAARAERLLLRTLAFVDEVYSAVGSRLQNLIGGTTTYHLLLTNGVDLLDDLRAEAGDSPAFRLALAQLETQLALGLAWYAGNTAADYEAGYATVTNVLQFLAPGPSETVGDQRLSKLARAEMVAGYAALELDRPQVALGHFRAWDGWAQRLARSTNAYFADEGRKYRRWASGSMGEALYTLGEVQKAMDDHWLPFHRELEARGVSLKSTNWLDLHDYLATANSLAKVHARLGQAEPCVRHRREAVSLAARRRQLFPHSAQDAAEEAIAQAELGASLLASPPADAEEGTRWLEAALAKVQQLIAWDRANLNFLECRIKVLRLQAEGLTKRACREDTSPAERRACLEQASACLRESEALFATLPRAAGPSLLRTELGRTRAELAAAQAQYGGGVTLPPPPVVRPE